MTGMGTSFVVGAVLWAPRALTCICAVVCRGARVAADDAGQGSKVPTAQPQESICVELVEKPHVFVFSPDPARPAHANAAPHGVHHLITWIRSEQKLESVAHYTVDVRDAICERYTVPTRSHLVSICSSLQGVPSTEPRVPPGLLLLPELATSRSAPMEPLGARGFAPRSHSPRGLLASSDAQPLRLGTATPRQPRSRIAGKRLRSSA